MSLIHICHVYKCRNQELKKKKNSSLFLHFTAAASEVNTCIQFICEYKPSALWKIWIGECFTCTETECLFGVHVTIPERWCLQTCIWAYGSLQNLHWRLPGWEEAVGTRKNSHVTTTAVTKGYDPSHGMKCCLCVQYLKLQRVQKLQTVHKRNASLPLLLISPVSLWDKLLWKIFGRYTSQK